MGTLIFTQGDTFLVTTEYVPVFNVPLFNVIASCPNYYSLFIIISQKMLFPLKVI